LQSLEAAQEVAAGNLYCRRSSPASFTQRPATSSMGTHARKFNLVVVVMPPLIGNLTASKVLPVNSVTIRHGDRVGEGLLMFSSREVHIMVEINDRKPFRC
jgi:hypothetical protein